MSYKRILTIQDISCVGQCSMTVALPILSACGHETCVLPTALLSTHTGGFGKPAVCDLTAALPAMIAHWKDNGIDFDLIYTGYLGSERAAALAEEVISELRAPNGIVVVDPAMADHGRLYAGLSEEYAKRMRALCERADVMLPNITEAAMMTGLPYREKLDEAYVADLLRTLGGREVVLTGVGFEDAQTGFAVRANGVISCTHHAKIGKSYHGTGDMFAAAFCGALAGGKKIAHAAGIAAEFTCAAIQNTVDAPAHWYGVKFETALAVLMERLKS